MPISQVELTAIAAKLGVDSLWVEMHLKRFLVDQEPAFIQGCIDGDLGYLDCIKNSIAWRTNPPERKVSSTSVPEVLDSNRLACIGYALKFIESCGSEEAALDALTRTLMALHWEAKDVDSFTS